MRAFGEKKGELSGLGEAGGELEEPGLGTAENECTTNAT